MNDAALVNVLLWPTSFTNDALAAIGPHLQGQVSSRTLYLPYAFVGSPSRTMKNIALVSSYGYNLLLLWVWHDSGDNLYHAVELMDDRLSLLFGSGLDVNSACSRFGPPAHTLIATVGLAQGYPANSS